MSFPGLTILKPELDTEVKDIFAGVWSERDGEVVPEPEDLKLGNDAVKLNATVLYADISSSSALVDSYKAQFAAEIYKTFLICAAKIIKDEEGVITAYDGDRVMGVYIGGSKNTHAVRTALRINAAVLHVVNPALKTQYSTSLYELKHVVGIDTSELLVGRIGVRNDNDLVWVGRAANYAAKLSAVKEGFATYITDSVYGNMHDKVKYALGGEDMWESRNWTTMNKMTIYRSNYYWTLV
jgi:class 3 adenylate cyclase